MDRESESDVMGNLPAFNADYILTYLSSVYGIIAAISFVLCSCGSDFCSLQHCITTEKIQLGMMMGCGCGMYFSSVF